MMMMMMIHFSRKIACKRRNFCCIWWFYEQNIGADGKFHTLVRAREGPCQRGKVYMQGAGRLPESRRERQEALAAKHWFLITRVECSDHVLAESALRWGCLVRTRRPAVFPTSKRRPLASVSNLRGKNIHCYTRNCQYHSNQKKKILKLVTLTLTTAVTTGYRFTGKATETI